MPQNTNLTQELSLATMVFKISVFELVKIAMLPKKADLYGTLSQLIIEISIF